MSAKIAKMVTKRKYQHTVEKSINFDKKNVYVQVNKYAYSSRRVR